MIVLGVLGIFVWAALLMASLSWLKRQGRYNIQQGESNTPNRTQIIFRNQIMSFFLVLGVSYLFGKYFVSYESASIVILLFETVSVLLLYDFGYYWMHRTFHNPKLMKAIHGVHHRSRKVSAPESLYLHPVENIAGLVLLFVTMLLFGVHAISFLIIFGCYTTVMILNHTGMVFPHPIFRPLNYMAVKHDVHHSSNLNANYASIFTFIFDKTFDTYD